MTESGAPYAPPPPPPNASAPFAPPFAPPSRPRRRSMALRHLGSVALALALTPVGILVFDYGAGRYNLEHSRTFDNSGTAGELALMFLGAAVLVAAAASARLSGLGPVLAGLVWGVLPFVWFLADLRSFFDFSQDLPSTHFWFSSPPYLFPLVAAMLLAAGLVGRWRGRVVA